MSARFQATARSRSVRAWRWTVPLSLLLCVACGEDGVSPGTEVLIGQWSLLSVNGQSARPGLLTWTVTSSTITAVSNEDDCTEVGSYTYANGTLSTTVISLNGTDCGGEVGDTLAFPVSIAGDTLTATITDPDLGTAVFVFGRA
jgi:hypothetical protein